MSAVSSLDADAFMRKYLQQPSDATARLVFADWLEEQGEAHNRAWAYYIRLKAETDRYPADSAQRHELDRQAGEYAVHIRARLTVPAKLFAGYPKSLLQLLPAPYLTVNLSRFAPTRHVLDHLPESLARENRLFPLDVQGRTILLAAADPNDFDTLQRLEFILNRDVVLVRADADDVLRAINREYGQTETVAFDSPPLVFVDTAIDHTVTEAHVEPPIVRLVNLILAEAVNLDADRVMLDPTPDALVVRHRVGGVWLDRDHIPRPRLRAVFERVATMAGIEVERVFAAPQSHAPLTGDIPLAVPAGHFDVHFDVHVTIQPSPLNPTAELAINPA
jgi:uncharacterized protein (TIGR02996 family)